MEIFSSLQKRILSWAATGIAISVLIALVFLFCRAAAKFLSVFGTVLWPVVIALLLALLLQPVFAFLGKTLKLPRGISAILIFVLIILVAAGILVWLVPTLVAQAHELAGQVPAIWNAALESHPAVAAKVKEFFVDGGLAEKIRTDGDFGKELETLLEASLPRLKFIWGTTSALAAQLVSAAVVPVYFYYFVSEQRDIIGELEKEAASLLPAPVVKDLSFLARQFRDIVIAFFRGQFLVVTCYGIILAVGFFISGLSGAVLFGLVLGYLNMVPYFGTMVGLGVVLPLAFFSGGAGTLAGVAVTFCVAQLAEAYFLTPNIMKKRTGLHPGVIIFSVFFWAVALDGILGMVLAVPLTAFLVVFWRLLKEKYLTKTATEMGLVATTNPEVSTTNPKIPTTNPEISATTNPDATTNHDNNA